METAERRRLMIKKQKRDGIWTRIAASSKLGRFARELKLKTFTSSNLGTQDIKTNLQRIMAAVDTQCHDPAGDKRVKAFEEDVAVALHKLEVVREERQQMSTHRERDRERQRRQPESKVGALVIRSTKLRVHLEELEKADLLGERTLYPIDD